MHWQSTEAILSSFPLRPPLSSVAPWTSQSSLRLGASVRVASTSSSQSLKLLASPTFSLLSESQLTLPDSSLSRNQQHRPLAHSSQRHDLRMSSPLRLLHPNHSSRPRPHDLHDLFPAQSQARGRRRRAGRSPGTSEGDGEIRKGYRGARCADGARRCEGRLEAGAGAGGRRRGRADCQLETTQAGSEPLKPGDGCDEASTYRPASLRSASAPDDRSRPGSSDSSTPKPTRLTQSPLVGRPDPLSHSLERPLLSFARDVSHPHQRRCDPALHLPQAHRHSPRQGDGESKV